MAHVPAGVDRKMWAMPTLPGYLALRLNETDAKLMAKIFAASDKIGLYTDRIKQMPKYRGMYYGEGLRLPISVALAPEIPVSHRYK